MRPGTYIVTAVAAVAILGPSIHAGLTDTDTSNVHVTCTHGRPHGYSKQQLANAATIVQVGRDMHIPEQGQKVALVTAMQESNLRNLDGGDRDSVGLFQQRPSQGWGSYAEVHDPQHASRSFYTALRKVPGWQHMPVTAAAQAVQRSAFPGAYAKWENDAAVLVNCHTK